MRKQVSDGSKPAMARPRGRGFAPASKLIERDIRKATESRGISLARLVTRWNHIVGEDLAKLCYPIRIKSHRQNLAASLQISTTSAAAPLVSAQKQMIVDRVNAAFGYKAIDRITLQHSQMGFAEQPTKFANFSQPGGEHGAQEVEFAKPQNGELAGELRRLAQNIANRNRQEP